MQAYFTIIFPLFHGKKAANSSSESAALLFYELFFDQVYKIFGFRHPDKRAERKDSDYYFRLVSLIVGDIQTVFSFSDALGLLFKMSEMQHHALKRVALVGYFKRQQVGFGGVLLVRNKFLTLVRLTLGALPLGELSCDSMTERVYGIFSK